MRHNTYWKNYNIERDEKISLREATTKASTIVDYWNDLVQRGETHLFSYADYNERGFNTLGTPSTTFNTMCYHLKNQGLIKNGDKISNPTSGQMIGATNPKPENTSIDPSSFGSSLQKILSLSSDFKEEEETVEDRVHSKYQKIAFKVRQLVKGRTAKEHLLVYGDAGVGKTFVVKSELAQLGLKPTVDYVYKQGSIGSSATDVARFLYIHRGTPENPELIVLDDADSFLVSGSQEIDNMLKGTLDGDGGTVSIRGTVVKKLTKEMQEYGLLGADEKIDIIKESTLKEWEKKIALREMIREMAGTPRKLFEADNFDEDEEDEDDEEMEDEDFEFPSSFTFYSKLILISNLQMKQLNPAVTSRCELVELNLTTEEFLIKLKEVLPALNTDRNKIPTDDWNWAKKCAMIALEAGLEASQRGIPLFGKRIRITRKLEFRVMLTLAASWIDITDIIRENQPKGMPDDDHMEEQREYLMKAAMGQFIVRYLIPTLNTTTS